MQFHSGLHNSIFKLCRNEYERLVQNSKIVEAMLFCFEALLEGRRSIPRTCPPVQQLFRGSWKPAGSFFLLRGLSRSTHTTIRSVGRRFVPFWFKLSMCRMHRITHLVSSHRDSVWPCWRCRMPPLRVTSPTPSFVFIVRSLFWVSDEVRRKRRPYHGGCQKWDSTNQM